MSDNVSRLIGDMEPFRCDASVGDFLESHGFTEDDVLNWKADISGTLLYVGKYKLNLNWLYYYQHNVYMTFDFNGKEVYEIDDATYSRVRKRKNRASDSDCESDESDYPTIGIEDIEWTKELDGKDSRERGNIIFEVMLYNNMSAATGWASYDHMVDDPGNRLRYLELEKAIKEQTYWVPTFEQRRFLSGGLPHFRANYILGTLGIVEDMHDSLKKIVRNRARSQDPDESRKMSMELFLALSVHADYIQQYLNSIRMNWSASVKMTAH